MDAMLEDAAARSADFVVWAFLRDYTPFGPWMVEQGLTDPFSYGVLNTWTCSGILDQQGADKGAVSERWRRDLAAAE